MGTLFLLLLTRHLPHHAVQRPDIISISRCLCLVALAFNPVFFVLFATLFTSLSKSLYTFLRSVWLLYVLGLVCFSPLSFCL